MARADGDILRPVRSAAAAGGDAKPAKRRRAPEEIRARLLEAATAEFEAGGYSHATTAAIARRAAVTEAQLFRYFPSKLALFREAVFSPLEAHIRRFAERSVGDTHDAAIEREQARAYITELRGFLRRHSRLLMAFLVAQAYVPGAEAMDDMGSLDRYFDQGAAMLAAGLGRDAEVDPRLMVRVSFAAALACELLREWLFPVGLADRDTIDRAVEVFIVDGVTPRRGDRA